MSDTKKRTGIFIDVKILKMDELDFIERAIYSQILFYTHDQKVCVSSNEYLAKSLHISVDKVKRTIKKLLKRKLIMIQKKNNNANSRVILRYSKTIIEHYERGDFNGTGLSYNYFK